MLISICDEHTEKLKKIAIDNGVVTDKGKPDLSLLFRNMIDDFIDDNILSVPSKEQPKQESSIPDEGGES